LFAALVKGLTAPISSSTVNIVNAEIIARERGIVVNEQRSRDPAFHSYSSLVTLVARPPSRASSRARAGAGGPLSPAARPQPRQIISGTCSGSQPIISRLDRFATSFVPEGTLLVCHNYDSPGKIGVVGSILGQQGVNINFMGVAPVSRSLLNDEKYTGPADATQEENGDGNSATTEALMILGVDRAVEEGVVQALLHGGGVLSVSVISL